MKKVYIIFLVLLIACASPSKSVITIQKEERTKESLSTKKAKNIIFFIGDGMGLSQITAGIYANGNHMYFEDFKQIGLHKSHSSDNLITDSAAGATAFSCGVKTYNGAIGVNADTIAIKTILEEASEKKMFTGLVSTSTIVHATPASFFAHNRSRKNYEEIALEFLHQDVNIFIGGGLRYFTNRSDERNIKSELQSLGYYMNDYFESELELENFEDKKRVGFLTSDKNPLKASQGRDYLPLATQKAIDFLDKKSKETAEGFFLMVEGSQIDWGGHANDGEYVITEMIDFNKAIKVALDYQTKNPETLIVITADHETGGLAINPKSKMDSLHLAFTSTYHTACMIPVFAKGPSASLFQGIYENTSIYHKLRASMGWE